MWAWTGIILARSIKISRINITYIETIVVALNSSSPLLTTFPLLVLVMAMDMSGRLKCLQLEFCMELLTRWHVQQELCLVSHSLKLYQVGKLIENWSCEWRNRTEHSYNRSSPLEHQEQGPPTSKHVKQGRRARSPLYKQSARLGTSDEGLPIASFVLRNPSKTCSH
jgi:hypothetical protein